MSGGVGPFGLGAEELLRGWRRGEVSDARLAEEVTRAVGVLNALFEQLREESGGAIDGHASVRISLPRPRPKGAREGG